MLKTNSRKARENVRRYIMDGFDGTNYDIEKPDTFEEAAKIIYSTFRSEKRYELAEPRIEQYVFKSWCQGLPSIIDTCYYYNRSAVADAGTILEETEEERACFDESAAEELLTYLIWREIKRVVLINN